VEKNIPKALISQILGAGHKWVAKMSPAQFVYVLVALAIITVGAVFYFFIYGRGPVSPASGSVAVWVSEMPDSTDPNDTREAKNLIIGSLDVFDVKTSEPTDSTGIVMTIMVGCYRTKSEDDAITKELRIGIPELMWDKQPKPYKMVSQFSQTSADLIVQEIRGRILDKYPPEGSIYDLEPEEEVAPEQRKSQKRKVFLDIGRLAGVREGDVFQVVRVNKGGLPRRPIRIEIMEAGSRRSMALVPWEQEIERGWSVKWISTG